MTDSWIMRNPKGGWIVMEEGETPSRHHRFWIIAFLDWLTS